MQKLIRTLGFAILTLPLAGCHILYVPDVQQGNLFDKSIDQKVADQLKPGLSKHQVLVLLGTPSVAAPFDQNRWDYVSTFSHRGEKAKENTFSLFFNNDTLVRIQGSLFASDAQKLVEDTKKYKTGYNVNDKSGDKDTSGDEKSGDSSGDSNGGSSDSSGGN